MSTPMCAAPAAPKASSSSWGSNEQQDYVELIDWIVQQPWCNGRVGGIGQSYYAMAQWLMATYNPPGLACIAPYDGLVDQYRGSNYHGGIYCSYRSVWYTSLRADNQHRLAGRHGRPPMKFDLVGAIVEHSLDDEFWRQRSPYWRLDKIKCPVLSIGHWGKMGLHLRGNILGYEEVKAPKKLVVTGARNTFEAHRMFDQIEFHEKELLPFYDLHLKGANNGFMDAEPVRLYVRGANLWRAPRAMAAAARDARDLLSAQRPVRQRHLAQRRRTVDRKAGAGRGGNELHLSGLGMGQRRRGHRARRQGRSAAARAHLYHAPLAEDLEVIGPIVLKLYASSTAIDTQFIVKLTDQHPQDAAARAKGEQPAYTPVSKGWLKASHREKDAMRSTPQRPFYTHTNPQPLTPGEIYAFDIEVLPIAYRVQEGPPHPAGTGQRRFAGDRRRILTSLSSVADGDRHYPSRRDARVGADPAADGARLIGQGASKANHAARSNFCSNESCSSLACLFGGAVKTQPQKIHATMAARMNQSTTSTAMLSSMAAPGMINSITHQSERFMA